MSPEWFAVAMQVVTAVGAVCGAYLAVRLQLIKLATEVWAIYKEIARMDAEIIRMRQSIDRRHYADNN